MGREEVEPFRISNGGGGGICWWMGGGGLYCHATQASPVALWVARDRSRGSEGQNFHTEKLLTFDTSPVHVWSTTSLANWKLPSA